MNTDQLIRKLDQINQDIGRLEQEDPLNNFPHLFTENAKLVQSAAINVLSSRKSNLLERLAEQIRIDTFS